MQTEPGQREATGRAAADLLDPRAALEGIRAAAERLGPYVRRTPTVLSYTLSESAGRNVFLKLENLQRTGSYKVRGALNKVLQLAPDVRGRGLVAASAGNHAQGVALAAKLVEVPATIVMPESTPILKLRRTEGYGAEVVLHGANYEEAHERMSALARERGLVSIHPFDDPDIIQGQGTVGLEILEDAPETSLLLVPIGGGGLISGIALAAKASRPDLRVVGIQAEGADPMVRSFHAGRRLEVERPQTIADGIKVGRTGELTYEIVRELVDDCVTVSDEEITDALVQTLEKSKVVPEPAGVAAVAALLAGKVQVPEGADLCAVVSGGNVDLNLLARLIESGLARAGSYHLVHLRMADTPGQLQRVLGVVAERRCNILDVQHHRAGWKVPIGMVDVEILLETRASEQGPEIERALAELGYEITQR